MDVAQFLESVAENGFTKACEIFEIGRTKMKDMCDYILKNSEHTLTPYMTKQQVVYLYCSVKIKQTLTAN